MDKDELNWRLFNEHVLQARQHEGQRERMTTLIVAISAATIAFISQQNLTYSDLLLSIPLILLGIFGARFSYKHYERNRMHVTISEGYLELIDEDILNVRKHREVTHKEKYPKTYHWKLHKYWQGIHIGISIAGLIISTLIIL
jgi:hypothetical protein